MGKTPNVVRVRFTLLDLLLVVIAFGFSAGMTVRATAGKKDIVPPLRLISNPTVPLDQEYLLFAFTGVVGLGREPASLTGQIKGTHESIGPLTPFGSPERPQVRLAANIAAWYKAANESMAVQPAVYRGRGAVQFPD